MPINARNHHVQPLLDRAMLECEQLNGHPLTGAATTPIAATDLPRLIAACGHELRILEPGRGGDRDDLSLGHWPARQIQLISRAHQMY